MSHTHNSSDIRDRGRPRKERLWWGICGLTAGLTAGALAVSGTVLLDSSGSAVADPTSSISAANQDAGALTFDSTAPAQGSVGLAGTGAGSSSAMSGLTRTQTRNGVAPGPSTANQVKAAVNAAMNIANQPSAHSLTSAGTVNITKNAATATKAAATLTVPTISTGSGTSGISAPSTVSMGVPATGAGTTAAGDTTVVYDGQGTANQIALQSTITGALRAAITITSPAAPEAYAFTMGGGVASLSLNPDGSVVAYDHNHLPIAQAPAPWAIDANGTPVPTHYEVNGTSLTQVIDHRNGHYVYGIVADPIWMAAVAVAGQCAGGALGSVTSQAILDVLHGKASSKKTYIEDAAVGCLLGPLGKWVWKFLPGQRRRLP